MEGRLAIGELTIFLSYLKDLYQPDPGHQPATSRRSRPSRAGLERVFSVLDVAARHPGRARTRGRCRRCGRRLRFENVSFGYEPGPPGAARASTSSIQPGEKVALVGKTGAGKSTLASLVLRFFDPQEGRVTHRRPRPARGDARARCAASVTLHAAGAHPLPHAPCAENIAFGAGRAASRDPRGRARRAEAEAFILELPQGYDTRARARTA